MRPWTKIGVGTGAIAVTVVASVAIRMFSEMTISEFKDYTDGLQSIAIVVAAMLGGGWALFQFFTLNAREVAKLELQKKKRELLERGVLLIDLHCESFEFDESYFLHVRVVLRNVGNGPEFVDWSKAIMGATRFEKVDETRPTNTGEVLKAFHGASGPVSHMRLLPAFTTSESFLIGIPKAGVYYLEFFVPASNATTLDTVKDLTRRGSQMEPEESIIWRADTFIAVPQGRSSAELTVVRTGQTPSMISRVPPDHFS